MYICIYLSLSTGYSTMCGHAILSLGRYALDYGIVLPVAPETRVNIQCPCGIVSVFVQYSNGKSGRARFQSVPAFVFAKDLKIELPVYGFIRYDIAYGGAFYAFATAKQFGLDLKTAPFESLRSAGACCSKAVRKQIALEHPESEDLAFLYGTILIDENDTSTGEVCAGFCVFADVQVSSTEINKCIKLKLYLGRPESLWVWRNSPSCNSVLQTQNGTRTAEGILRGFRREIYSSCSAWGAVQQREERPCGGSVRTRILFRDV